MTEPPWVPGPNQKPPPLPEFAPPPTTKKFVPWKFKVYAIIVVILGLYLLIGLLK